jgi:hypothetical protein
MLVEARSIPTEEVEIYMSSRYQVFTIIPSVTDPVMNTYVFTLEELEAFLKNYTRHGEFIVAVKQFEATA